MSSSLSRKDFVRDLIIIAAIIATTTANHYHFKNTELFSMKLD